MPPTYAAVSRHINVQQGDAALYDLLKDGNIISRVLVDSANRGPNNLTALEDFIDKYAKTDVGGFAPLDAVVITHWDSDHYRGLYEMFIKEWQNTPTGNIWRPSFFRFKTDGKTPLTRFYCPYFKDTPPDRGDLKPSFEKFAKDASGQYLTVMSGSQVSEPIAILRSANLIGADFFNTLDEPPLASQSKLFNAPRDLVDWHHKPARQWQQKHPGAPGLYCVAQNWTYIGPGPDLMIFNTESSTYTNQSSIAAILMWADYQMSIYTAGDRDDPREEYITEWVNCGGGPSKTDHITTVKAGHHGAATSTYTDVLNKFNPENIIFSAGSDYAHPRYELMFYLSAWNQRNKLKQTPKEYRDFKKPVTSLVFPYWLAKDTNDDWVVLPENKMSTTAMDDAKFDDFRSDQAKIWQEIQGLLTARKAANPGYDTTGIMQDPIAAYQAAIDIDDDRATRIREICQLAAARWMKMSDIGPELYPSMSSAKGWVYGPHTQVTGLRDESILYIKVSHQQPWYQDGTVTIFFRNGSKKVFRDNSGRADPTTAALVSPQKTEAALEDASPIFPILPARVRGAFPSRGHALTSDDLYVNPDDDPDEATDPLPATGKAGKIQPLTPYPTLTWPPGNYFYSTGGIQPQGPEITASGFSTRSSFGGFLYDLHMQLIGLSQGVDSEGWSSVLQKDELPTWFTTVLKPSLGTVALQVKLNSSRAPEFSDMQLAVPLLFGASIVFNVSSVAAAFPRDITPLTGVVVDESMAVMGLDPTQSTTVLKTTTGELLTYLSLPRKLPFDLGLTLDPSKSTGNRNAVWFVPGQHYATSFRSAWTTDGTAIADLNTFLEKFGLGIHVDSAEVIAVKRVEWAVPDPEYDSSMTLGITVDINNTQLAAYVELNPSSTDMTLVCVDGGPSLSDLVDWVTEPFSPAGANGKPPTGNEVKTLIEKIGQNIRPRRVKVSLDDEDSLVYCQVSFEVDMKIGQAPGAGQTVASLFTFSWSEEGGLGLSGNFFPAAPALLFINNRTLIPGYEEYRDLKPEAKDAVSSIDLRYLIPDSTITDIPGSVHPAIQAASFSVTADEVRFYAMITTVETPSPENSSPAVPHLRLGLLALSASYSEANGLFLECDLRISLTGKQDAGSRQALLLGSLVYMRTSRAQNTMPWRPMLRDTDSMSSWQVSAGIQFLQVGTLYEFFDADSQDGVLGLIGHIEIVSLDFVYNYSSGNATDFTFKGALLLGPLQLEVDYHYPSTGLWKFHAKLAEQPGVSVTLSQLVAELQNKGSPPVVLPGFVGDVVLSDSTASLEVTAQSSLVGKNPTVFVTVDLKIGDFEVLFVQFQEKGSSNPKRLFRAAVTGLGEVDNVPIIDKISQPFDDMYFLYVVDGDPNPQGISKAELDAVNGVLAAGSPPLIVKQTMANPTPADILIKPGAHFVVAMTVNNVPTAVVDYGFTPDEERSPEVITGEKSTGTGAEEQDSGSGQAPLNKTLGPLTLNNIGLLYKDGSLGVLLDATFKLGPIQLNLVGFSLLVPLKGLTINSLLTPKVSMTGLAVSFDEPPTSMAGGFAKLSEALYVGGLTVSFEPYVLTAAGAYGTITDAKGNQFKTVAMFAQLQGPLIELEFVEVSGMTLGFGYNSHLTLPTVDTVTSFPLVGPKPVPSGNAIDIFGTLQTPSPPAPNPPWILPQSGSLWIAAGLNAAALSTLTVSALVVLEFSASATLGLYASAVAQFPTTSPAILYAELGLAGTIDFSAGTLLIQAKLSPYSYILDPSCHLTGGFALGYWFGSNSHTGDFFLTLGGYNPAYTPPVHYPTPAPERLGISWSLNGCLSITGRSYMTVTPKSCMVGSSLHAALSLGPLSASFDAWADFLVNFQPFWFQGDGGVSVRVEFTLDLWIVTIHIDVEIGASLSVWGPSMAGTVHVDFWVFGFDINFGSSGNKPDTALLVGEFYQKVLLQNQAQASSKSAADGGEGKDHTVTCVKGLVPSPHGTTETALSATWNVRGGVFAFSVKSVFPFTHAAIVEGGEVPVPPDAVNPVYSKPMWRTETDPLDTTIAISIFEGEDGSGNMETITGFQIAGNIAHLPNAIWGKYTTETDPLVSSQGNQIKELLNGDDPTVPLLNGVTVTAPKPFYSTDIIPPFNVLESNMDVVNDGAVFNVYNVLRCSGPWDPAPVVGKVAQYGVVERTWMNPSAGPDAAQKAADTWAAALWAGPGETPPVMVGTPPVGMLGENKAVFELDYLEAPMVSVAAA